MRTRMLGTIFIFIWTVLFLSSDGQELTCSKSLGSSCPSFTPLVSGPTCPDGFDLVEKQCFKVSDDRLFWNESKLRCEELNAKLAEPRELLNSTVFLNYLFQHVDSQDNSTYDYYEYYDWYDRVFVLGGQYTNNSWEWLTGGNISYGHIYGEECLAVGIYNNKDYDYDGGPRSMVFDDIGYSLGSIPCNSSYVVTPGRNLVEVNFRHVCQSASEDISYSPCFHNGQQFSSGELVSMQEQNCEQDWCEAGIIKQYTCGNITNSCCEYKSKLYGNGDIIGPEVPTNDCVGCQQLVCLAGVVQWRECTNCSVKCCLFNGTSYQPGDYIPNTCARLVCEGTTGELKNLGIDYDCPKCKAYLDPHIVTYDQKWSSYSYQGCGNYSLSQVSSSYQPALAVYANFEPCGGRSTLTCVGTVTFKNDEHTVITLRYDDNEYRIKIEVNGKDINMDSSYSPSIVQVMYTVYPVLAWKSYNCVNLQGSSGILVRFCGSSWTNQVYVWAYPDVAEDLEGLCGTVNDDVDDDFRTREGNITSPWQRNPHLEFPLSWLANATSNGSCDGGIVRAKRQVKLQNDCDTNSTVIEQFRSQCRGAVNWQFSDADQQEVQTIIDDCVFDLCNVSDPREWIQAVRETAQVQANIQQNTLNFSSTTTTLPPTTFESDTTAVMTTTTVEPSTTMPNTTIDCNCKRKCWKKSGFCTNEPEICDGRVRYRGCEGTNCVCCIPDECRPKKKCYKKGGFCMSTKETCDGNTIKGCWGEDCVCCLKTDRCKPKRECWKKGGSCVSDPNNCKGEIIENGCKSENCFCCVSQPKC